MESPRRTVKGRNRIDFVPPGNVAGQIAEVGKGFFSEHTELRHGEGDAHWDFVEHSIPGMDTEVRLWGHPFLYQVRAIPTDDGPRVVELHIDSPEHDVPLTAEDLRKLAKLLDRLAYAATKPPDPSTSAFDEPEKAPPKRPGRHGNPGHYEKVAEFARTAHRQRGETGLSVRRAIAEKWTVSEHTAEKWLARARKAGHLQPGELGGRSRKSGRES